MSLDSDSDGNAGGRWELRGVALDRLIDANGGRAILILWSA